MLLLRVCSSVAETSLGDIKWWCDAPDRGRSGEGGVEETVEVNLTY